MEERLEHLLVQEEDCFHAVFHQQVEKAREKAWHDRHIKQRTFKNEDLVLQYDNKLVKFLGKFKMHWLGSYIVRDILDGGSF